LLSKKRLIKQKLLLPTQVLQLYPMGPYFTKAA